MKKVLYLLILLTFLPFRVESESSIRSNDLHLDQERLSQEEEKIDQDTHQLLAELFLQGQMEVLKKGKDIQKKHQESLQDQLFASYENKQTEGQGRDLFSQRMSNRTLRESQGEEGSWLSPPFLYLYGVAILLLLVLYATYTTVKEEESGHTFFETDSAI